MKPVDQALYRTPCGRYDLRGYRLVVDPAVRRETHARLVSKDSCRSRGAIDDINVCPEPFGSIRIAPADEIIRKVGLHIVLGDRRNTQLLPRPTIDIHRNRIEGHRQFYRCVQNRLKSGCYAAIGYPGSDQQQHGHPPRQPQRRATRAKVRRNLTTLGLKSGSVGVYQCVYPFRGTPLWLHHQAFTDAKPKIIRTGWLDTSSIRRDGHSHEALILRPLSTYCQADSSQNCGAPIPALNRSVACRSNRPERDAASPEDATFPARRERSGKPCIHVP